MNQIKYDHQKKEITLKLKNGISTVIKKTDLEISYFSSGKGGQNVNRHLNGVRLIYRIPKKLRIYSKKTTTLLSKSHQQRYQEQNFNLALKQLAKKISKYFYTKPIRKKAEISKKQKEKRLHNKKLQSLKKASRQRVRGDL